MEACWLPFRGPDRRVSLWSLSWQDCFWTVAEGLEPSDRAISEWNVRLSVASLTQGASRSQLSGAGARALNHSVVHCTGQAKVRGCSLVQEDELFLGL